MTKVKMKSSVYHGIYGPLTCRKIYEVSKDVADAFVKCGYAELVEETKEVAPKKKATSKKKSTKEEQ